MGDQQFDDLSVKFHMALEAINPIAIFHNLPRAAFAGGQHFRFRRQARHIVMPVAHDQRRAKMGQFAVLLAGGGERYRKVADLFLRTLHDRRAQRFADKLRTETNPHHDPPGGNGLRNQTLLGVGIKIWAFG